MRSAIITILSLLAFTQMLFGQLQDTIILSSPLTGIHDTVAAYAVVMIPGFSYTPSTGNSFTARTDPEGAQSPGYDLIGGPGGTIGELVGDDGVVGAIPGQFAVSQVGGALYNIPVECPPGIGGMTPSVSLVYNSQSGNGIAGWGWNVSGQSTISRTGKSYYYDQDAEGIKWDGTDNFNFDGQRLFVKAVYPTGSSTITADSIEYLTDNDLSTRIVGYSFSDDGPSGFRVWTAQGRILEYSQKQNLAYVETTTSYGSVIYELEDIDFTSIVSALGSYKTLGWNLTKISDRFGNDIIYEYDHDDVQGMTSPAETLYFAINDVNYLYPILPEELEMGEQYLCIVTQDVSYQETNFRLKKIRYADDDYSVDFSYATRNDIINGYISGQQMLNSKRLTSVKVNYQTSTTIKDYQLTYQSTSAYSKLLKITLTGQNSEKYNSTVFNWEEPAYSCDISSTYTFAPTAQTTLRASQGYSEVYHLNFPADFNGDGKTDFFVYYKYENSTGDKVYDWAAFLNTGSISQLQTCGEGTMPLELKYNLIDRDNDGRTEVYVQFFGTNGPGLAYARFEGYEYNGSAIVRDANLDFTMQIGGSPYEVKLINSDFDGDGKSELLLLKDAGLTYCSSLDFPDPPRGTTFNVPFTTSYGYFLSDINGNGKQELVLLQGNRIEVWEYNKTNYEFKAIHYNYSANKDDFLYNGDFNGDGNADLLVRDDSAQDWFILTSNGKSWQTGLITAPPLPFDIYFGKEMYMVQDVNQDGKSDIIESHYTGTGINYELKFYIFHENSFSLALTKPVGVSGLGRLRYTGEANADLTTDVFSGQYNPFYYSFTTNSGFHQIETIYNGIGRDLCIDYKKNFTKYSTSYSIDEETTGTNVLIAPVLLKTVSSLVDGPSTVSFDFSDPIIHLNGKGFMGFGQIDKTVVKNNLSTQTTEVYDLVSKGSNQYELVPDTVINKVNNNLVSASYMSYLTKTVNNRTYLVNDETVSENTEDNTKTVSNYSDHDQFLFPLVITTKSYAGNTEEASTYDSLTYTHNTNDWLIGQLNAKTTFRQRPGVPDFRRAFDYTYYSNGSLHEEYSEMGSDMEVKNTYTYDSYGNIGSITTIPSQNQNDARTISYTYSANGRYPLTKTDVLDNVQTYEYYPETGLLSSITDANDFETEYVYDGFGRLTNTIYPDANETNSVLAWAENDSDAPEGSMYCRIEESSGNAPQKAYYDKYGKELRVLSYGLTGEAIYIDTHYDLSDRVSEVSNPYFAGGSALWTTYAYDSYNRTNEIQTPDGNTTGYAYSPRQTTVTTETTSGDRSSTTKTNSLGEIIESTDNGNNTVLTTYYASGLPKQISVDGAQFSTTLTYDVYGNRTTITDPDAGTVASEYNALGYLITSTDNDGNVTTNTYDKSGRVLTSVLDNVTTTYTYDSQIIGQISSVTNGNSSITYDYDDLGRLESQGETLVETGGNKTVTQSFTYDEYGRIETKAWSGGYGITFDYNNYGHLYRIRDENYTLWNATAQNAYGQYTAYNQGSHNTGVTYTPYGELNQMVTPGVRNMEYSFNRLGNLVLRKDNLSNQKEVFDYDDLDRLTGIEYYLNNILQTSEGKTVYYDSYGNITGKTGIAACDSILYGENGFGPHALTSIWHPGDYLPPDQQISYTPFNKVFSISDTLSGSIVRQLEITYGYDKQRRKSVYTDGTIARTKYYFGDYEEHIESSSTTKYFFVYSPTGLCGVYIIEGSNPGQLYYSFTDHLGSITELVDAATGTNIIRQSFDAWGNPRSVSDWTSQASYQLFADRGFTGHEHLEEFSLINMNGRIYDPMLGRFLSPDPYVQLPDFSQSFNRYAYCLNNPLVFTDPAGEIVWFIPVIIGAVIGGASGAIMADQAGAQGFWEWAGYVGGGALIGGLSGGAAAGVSTLGGGAMLAGAAAGAVGGAGFSGMATGWDGSAMVTGAINGAIAGFIGGGVGSAIGGGWGALAGGAASNLTSQLLYNDGDFSSVNWGSVACSGALSLGMYHGMSYATWKWGGANNIGGHEISYRQFTRMNADFQRSRFWRNEHGGYLLNDGSVQKFPASSRHNYAIDPTFPVPDDAFASYHTHWEKPGINVMVNPNTGDKVTDLDILSGNARLMQTTRYHSTADLQFDSYIGLDSYVINRYDFSYHGAGSGLWYDPFIRFFMFPFRW